MELVRAMCVAVSRERAEETRRRLLDEGLLRTDLRIRHDDEYVYLPVTKKATNIGNVKNMEFERIKIRRNFRDILLKKVNVEISSFDIIGDIALIRIPPESIKYRGEIGNAILSTNKHVKTVCMDMGVKQDYRVRDIKVIAGEERTETTHVEYGIKIKVDVAKVYYSPRLASERGRIAGLVKEGEVVVDMFAGVAPFSVLIAKLAKPFCVYAIDLNPVAVEYASLNVKENGVDDIVRVMKGNARDIVPSLGKADHLIMNLPHSSREFFPIAINAGRNIHYYEIMDKEKVKERLEKLKSDAMDEGKKAEVEGWHIVGGYSPSKVKVGVDFIIH